MDRGLRRGCRWRSKSRAVHSTAFLQLRNQARRVSKNIGQLFTALDIHPVLMEIGGRDRSLEAWDSIACHSIYVGVGPESRLLSSHRRKAFYRTYSSDQIVVSGEDSKERAFYLTSDPLYSSVLRPKPANNSDFLDSPCHLDREVKLPTTTVNALMRQFQLSQLDWLQTNVNGVDQRIYESIEGRVRSRILVLDTVFDIVDLWRERGSPVSACENVQRDGFWLSRMSPYGFVRMRSDSVRRIQELDHRFDEQVLTDQLRRTPGWLFARFFRSMDSLSAGDFSQRDYIVLWAFALLDEQAGYAADLVFEYERVFGADEFFECMLKETLARMRRSLPANRTFSAAKKCVPAVIRRGLKPLLLRNAE